MSSRRFELGVGVTAVGLGLLAFAADLVGGIGGHLLVALTSSGFAWGLAAFLAGRSARTRRQAMIGSTALLVLSTLLYYLLVLLVSRRWSGAYLEDGTSADLYGLRSVAIMTGLWLLGSVVAGPLLGLLGHAVRSTDPTRAALAAGTGCGLLSGEGWAAVARAPFWRFDFDDPYTGDFAIGLALAELVRVVLPVVALVALMIVHRLHRRWPAATAAAIAAGLASTLVWQLVREASNWL